MNKDLSPCFHQIKKPSLDMTKAIYSINFLILITIIFLCFSVSLVWGEVAIRNEWSKKAQYHPIRMVCQEKEDIQLSEIPGFFSVRLMSIDKKKEGKTSKILVHVKHLPASQIREINEFYESISIIWHPVLAKDGNGYETYTILIPYKVIPREETFEMLKEAIAKANLNKNLLSQ